MTNRFESNDVTVSVSTHDGELAITFCDANVAQWSEPVGSLAVWGDDIDLANRIEDSIRDNAGDLAETIVASLRKKITKHCTEGANGNH